eukprot:CAMPEP_0116132552 /NCGR_PEP_ID=MMETSP0329-20121206/9611_1 /TAXON_ID=697910 /ORGANISM="Pseudo-nitzschia arenysensis, Strain B593" /LENGTH=619 /DNA_ID=CAMNT_0003627079 /DNA_START=58 /DNA_END=1917 /DNA_ORIENTATION=-
MSKDARQGEFEASSPAPHVGAPNGELNNAASTLMKLNITPPVSLQKIYPVGTRTKKYFDEFEGWFEGTIRSYNQETKFYSVEYEDNDTEDLEHHEIFTGPLPVNKYDIGSQYEIYFVSKQSGKKIGWFVGTVRSKYYHDPKQTWRYNVEYNDGDLEDVDEDYITSTMEKAKRKKEEPEEDGCDDGEVESSSKEEEEEDSSLEDDEEDPNPDNIPYWTGKQHRQFLVGLEKFGLGNLEGIHDANCIPDRSFQELVRYWYCYASDMEEKGLVLNYERKGTVNGKKGSRDGIGERVEGINGKDKKDGQRKELNANGFYAGTWTGEEKEMVVKASVYAGSTYKTMSDYMKTRSAEQISNYYQRNKKEINAAVKKLTDEDPPNAETNKGDTAKSKAWTPGEHALLVEAVAICGSKGKDLEAYMKSRSASQIHGHLKRSKRIEKEVAAKKQYLKKKFPKKTGGAWTSNEMAMLLEGYAIFQDDYKLIADYVKTRSEAQVQSQLEGDPSRFEDESDFDLGDHFSFPIELYHVLNVAPFEGFDHIISWNANGDSILIHNNVQFSKIVFPIYSHKGTPVQTFYDNLERFGFEDVKGKKPIENTGAFRHSALQKEDYKKVEQFCRKAFG